MPPKEEPGAGGPDAPLTAIGPLLEPAPIVVDRDEEEGPDAEVPPVTAAGPLVEAALADPPVDDGVATPSPAAGPLEAVEPVPEVEAPPAEPLDLLDTSTAPWLRDPELGVAWRESWSASQAEVVHEPPVVQEGPPAGVAPAAEGTTGPLNGAPRGGEGAVPAQDPPPAPPAGGNGAEPGVATPATRPPGPHAGDVMPPRRRLPEIHFLSEPPPPGHADGAPAREGHGAEPEPTPPVLPPRTYRPRSLERRFGPEQAGPKDGRWAPPLTYTPPLPPPPEPPREPAPSPAKRAQAALADAVEGAAVAEVVSRPWRKPSSGEWGLAAAAGVLGGLAIALALWATGPGRDEVVVERYRVPVVELPAPLEGLRIAHVSDLLVPGSAEVAARAAALVARERPDVVVLTGDLLDGSGAPALEALAPLLPKLRGRLATFAVSGEHDLTGGVTRAGLAASLAAQGITLLDGTRRNVVVDGATIAFLGATGDSAATAALHATGPRALAVWAMHAPGWLATTASLPLRDEGALLLAGHTRGGQVRLPFTRGLRPGGSGPYVGGFYPVGNGLLHVSRGIGTEGMRARLLSAPSVTVLTLGKGTVAGEAPVVLK